jgi:hypothetical protein
MIIGLGFGVIKSVDVVYQCWCLFDFFVSFCSFALNSIFLCDWHYHMVGKW